MVFHSCHFFLPQPLSLEQIEQRLCEAGLASLRDEMAAVFTNRVSFLGIKIEPPIDIRQDSDILSRTDGQGLCHVRVEMAEGDRAIVEMHVIARDADIGSQLIDICKCFTEAGQECQGTLRESKMVERLAKRLTDSTNGKMLKDEIITSFLSDLYNLEIRACIKATVQMFGQDGVPQQAIIERFAQAVSSKKASALVKSLTSEDKLFDKRYILACDSCGTPILEFPSQEEAKHSLEKASGRKCKICDEGTIGVAEAYAVKEAVYKGLQQGLWLESLAYNVVKPLTIFCRVGQMVDPFELDVIAVAYDKTILIECKDTSFGQNDFINLDAKAREIEADVIGIVTTQPLHENVDRFIQRTREQTGRTTFVVADTGDSAEISSKIEAEVAKIRADYICNLLSGLEGEALPAWLRRGRRAPSRWRV